MTICNDTWQCSIAFLIDYNLYYINVWTEICTRVYIILNVLFNA